MPVLKLKNAQTSKKILLFTTLAIDAMHTIGCVSLNIIAIAFPPLGINEQVPLKLLYEHLRTELLIFSLSLFIIPCKMPYNVLPILLIDIKRAIMRKRKH